MNFTTHVMFGLLIGALFFGKPELILLIGLGSAIPDLDREYAFLSRDKFRDYQIHRALCHNYLFIALLYLVNPFVALGAFLHTLLDALTTARDRGVEWLFPFSRLVKSAANDERGKKLSGTKPRRIYFYQYDPIELTRRSDKDLQEQSPSPWRRTYGPALSGGLLDQGIFLGSLALFIVWSLYSRSIGTLQFFDLSHYQASVMIPLAVCSVGIAINLLSGEVDRRKPRLGSSRPSKIYGIAFGSSLALVFAGIVLGAILNPGYIFSINIGLMEYFAIGSFAVLVVALVLFKVSYNKLVREISRHHDAPPKEKTAKEDEGPVII